MGGEREGVQRRMGSSQCGEEGASQGKGELMVETTLPGHVSVLLAENRIYIKESLLLLTREWVCPCVSHSWCGPTGSKFVDNGLVKGCRTLVQLSDDGCS